MLLHNDLLAYTEPQARTIRVLWIHPARHVAFVIDASAADAMPELMQLEALQCDLESGRAQILVNDPYLSVLQDAAIPKEHKQRRDHAWQTIGDLVCDQPKIFCPRHRAKRVTDRVNAGVASRPTIYLYLRRYWQRGQTPNALLPDYANSGAKGKKRVANPDVKRGRPRKFGDLPGLNVTEEIRTTFRVAVQRFYVTQKTKFTLQAAYDQMIKDFFCERSIDPDSGRVTHSANVSVSTSGFPSFGQFQYWLNQDHDRLDIERKRLGTRVYDKDLRGLLGTSTAEVWGPGARFQIDATIADVYLVSRIDRHKIIGRPVLYIVIDVFSRMIVGMFVGLEGPSWVGAMMALANTAADKQAFCKELGKEIAAEEWPCHYLPAIILGDRGEIEASMIDTLRNNFQVTVENAAAYRADWKGIGERRFRLLPAKFKPYVQGYIDVDFRARGGKDYRLDAVLDLTEFTQIILGCVLYYNNFHQIKDYDKDADLAADNVPPIPIDLWEWGIANRSGCLRQFSEVHVRFSLLPAREATVTQNGIRLQGIFYTCQKAIEERWFDRARQGGTWKVKVSYDPRDMGEVYLHDSGVPMQFHVCQMTQRSRAHRQMSMWEIGQQQESDKHMSATRQPRQQLALADLTADIEGIVSNAVKKKGVSSTESNASRTKNIRAHRAEEKQLNRKFETFRFSPENSTPVTSADILAFPGVAADDYSEPEISEIIASIGDGDAKL